MTRTSASKARSATLAEADAARQARAGTARAAFRFACWLDVAAFKPGNVSFASAGHRMHATDFLASAVAAAPALCAPDAAVGTRIEGAVAATWRAVGCNTNLGIVLLCAPLAQAWLQHAAADQPQVTAVLQTLTLEDARAAYRAIAQARPAGLGTADAQDVRSPDGPTLDLRAAMALAAARDRIAAQYSRDFDDLFGTAVPVFERFVGGAGIAAVRAMEHTFVQLLAQWPDSHVERKFGQPMAQTVMAEARPWAVRSRAGDDLGTLPAFITWDRSLKARGINPGTTADLCVATAFAVILSSPKLQAFALAHTDGT